MERMANMRVVIAVLFGAMAVSAGPSFAKTSDTPKTSNESSSSPSCHGYEQSPDGSWKQVPCQEDGFKPLASPAMSTRDPGKINDTGKATR